MDDVVAVKYPEMEMLRADKQDGINYRERRQDQWTENYTLYRDTVLYNRLTQRQSVNVPLMKMSLRTLLSQYDDMPMVTFEELSNNGEKETFLNEYWKYTGDRNRFEIQDIVDKKQEQFFGRSFDQWQVLNGMLKQTIVSPEDIVVSRNIDPTNIHSSRYLIHMHIFMPLSTIEGSDEYDKDAVKDLVKWFASNQGLIKAKENEESYLKKQQKMADLGLIDAYDPSFGETVVELTLYFRFERSESGGGEEIYYRVCAEDNINLTKNKKQRLEEVIGTTSDNWWRTHYPYNSWAGDVDNQDFWTDGAADIVRTSNKIANTWWSQLVENRTLKNFNMQYWDGTVDGASEFIPQTFEPKPWAWLKVPGKPEEVIKQVQVSDLGDSLDELKFAMEINERATGATSTQQGVQTERKVTLGEVELALNQAQERIKGTSKFYTQVWKDRAVCFLKMVEAAGNKLDAVKVSKKGRNTDKLYTREISPLDWQSEVGYQCRVWSQNERSEMNTAALEKWNAVKGNMPDNPKVDQIFKRKLLEFAEATPEDSAAIMEYEDRKQEMIQQQMEMQVAMAIGGGGELAPNPMNPGAPQPPNPMGQPGGAPPMMA